MVHHRMPQQINNIGDGKKQMQEREETQPKGVRSIGLPYVCSLSIMYAIFKLFAFSKSHIFITYNINNLTFIPHNRLIIYLLEYWRLFCRFSLYFYYNDINIYSWIKLTHNFFFTFSLKADA